MSEAGKPGARPRSIRVAALAAGCAACVALALGLAACGGSGSAPGDGERTEATLVLDFVPGPAHAGIYTALERGYYADRGIDLRIVEPTSTADTLKLIDAGKADFGIADGSDVAGQIAAGRGAKGILALTQRPLGGLITLREEGIRTPADLEGRTVGVTGVPSDDAVLATILRDGGLEPDDVRKVTVGFNGARSLENRKLDAFTGFIPADGVQVELDGFPTRSFPLDEHGGPRYPGLVVFSTEEQIAADPKLMRGFVAATVAGYEDVIADPGEGADALLAANPAIPEDFAAASLRALNPLWVGDAPGFGVFRAERLRELSAYMVDNGLAGEPIPPARYATNEFVRASGASDGGD